MKAYVRNDAGGEAWRTTPARLGRTVDTDARPVSLRVIFHASSGSGAGLAEGAVVRHVRILGLAGLLGASLFALALLVLHLARPEVDWARHYVSEFANGSLGWMFVSGAMLHGLGNLALTLGLYRSLEPGALREGAVVFFGLAAAGIVAAALVPVDPVGSLPSLAGLVHRAIVIAAFPIELVALVLFSIAFARQRAWRARAGSSFALSAVAALGLIGFFLALYANAIPGAAERLALGSFLAWELWAALVLARQSGRVNEEGESTVSPDSAHEDSRS